MAGKGKRRREKNYKAAHGGGVNSRLPPPPNASSVDTLPSKLRKLISLTGLEKQSSDSAQKSQGNSEKKRNSKHVDSEHSLQKGSKGENTKLMPRKMDNGSESEKKKKKRKRKTTNDLRFEDPEEAGGTGLKRKERKKQRLEEKKKKNKKGKEEEDMEFPRHEIIKFGDIVEAPPKLSMLPKRFANTQDASHQRLRLQAVENYRQRKGWASRPGTHIPVGPVTEPAMF